MQYMWAYFQVCVGHHGVVHPEDTGGDVVRDDNVHGVVTATYGDTHDPDDGQQVDQHNHGQ